MGLGKTLQTLVHIQIEKDAGRLTTPALIIVPVSVLGNWQREASKFCPQLRTLIVHGKERHEAASNLSDLDVVIAPYSLLQRDRDRWLSKNLKRINDSVCQARPSKIILVKCGPCFTF
jgi:SNF2 family DNA or RNA helicase